MDKVEKIEDIINEIYYQYKSIENLPPLNSLYEGIDIVRRDCEHLEEYISDSIDLDKKKVIGKAEQLAVSVLRFITYNKSIVGGDNEGDSSKT